CFGPFCLNTARGVLLRDGQEVHLGAKAYAALCLLVERSGQLVSKDELMLALWPGLHVEENNLNQQISALRRALGDDGRWIVTVPRRGYRFDCAVSRAPAEPIRPASQRRRWRQAILAAGTLVVAVLVVAFLRWAPHPRLTPASGSQIASLAVLPFQPLAPATDAGGGDYLGLGLADTVATRPGYAPE